MTSEQIKCNRCTRQIQKQRKRFVRSLERMKKVSTQTMPRHSPHSEDAIQIGPEGPICGRQAIEKKYVDLFRQSHPANIICTIDQMRVLGNVSWNSGAWSCAVQGENGPVPVRGYRLGVLVRECDACAWRECISCYNVTPASTAPSHTGGSA